jgi:hydroxyethylthiazole kinase-like sugar kinase family protein
MEKNMTISQFIDDVVAGNASNAKETLNDLLSSKAFEAISGQKKEIASSLFGGSSEEIEIQDTEDTETETEE